MAKNYLDNSNRPKYNSRRKKRRLPGNILIRAREHKEDLNQERASYQSANMSNCLESFKNEKIVIFTANRNCRTLTALRKKKLIRFGAPGTSIGSHTLSNLPQQGGKERVIRSHNLE